MRVTPMLLWIEMTSSKPLESQVLEGQMGQFLDENWFIDGPFPNLQFLCFWSYILLILEYPLLAKKWRNTSVHIYIYMCVCVLSILNHPWRFALNNILCLPWCSRHSPISAPKPTMQEHHTAGLWSGPGLGVFRSLTKKSGKSNKIPVI